MPIIDEEDAKAYCVKPKFFSEGKVIVIIAIVMLFIAWCIKDIVSAIDERPSVKLIANYPESVTLEQGKQKMTVDGAQMTKFVLSGVRVIVNGDTLKNVKCEMVKVN
jgi:hypothetical protein